MCFYLKRQSNQANNISELSSLFETLNEVNQEYALIVLQTLRFAQGHEKQQERVREGEKEFDGEKIR